MNTTKNLKGEAGFTIIEMMMAVVILAIGILAIVALQTSNVARNNTAKHQSEGYTWAMDQIETLLNLNYTHADLAVQGDPINVVDNDGHVLVRAPYTVEWDVADNGAAGLNNIENSKRVHVSVRWSGREVAAVDFVRTQISF
jgi:type IV pilus assembly protein PilV